MTSEKVAEITRERLDSWARVLDAEHSTPILLVGVGHDHKEGEIQICIPENVPDTQIAHWLQGALNLINSRN